PRSHPLAATASRIVPAKNVSTNRLVHGTQPTASMRLRRRRRRSPSQASAASSRSSPPARPISVASLANSRKLGSCMGAIWPVAPDGATAYGPAMHPAPAHRPLLALLVRLGAIGVLATMSALIKLAAERGIHLLEIMFWRQFLTIPIALGWVLATTGLASLATKRPGTHLLRGLFGTVGMILN